MEHPLVAKAYAWVCEKRFFRKLHRYMIGYVQILRRVSPRFVE